MQNFKIDPHQLKTLSTIQGACYEAATVHALDMATDGILGGVARHIVEPDSSAFPQELTPDCRLRITSTLEIFIPLHQVLEAFRTGNGVLHLRYDSRRQPCP